MRIKVDASDFNAKAKTFLFQTRPKLKMKLLRQVGTSGAKYAQQRCPVDTGNLKSTIRIEMGDKPDEMIDLVAGGTKGFIENSKDVNYARFVHDGTIRMIGRPFLIQGARQALQDLRNF